jgi:alpha-glucosidase
VSEDAWWRSAVIYQIYPRSFQDSNGDGVGDLPGIIHRLPYLAALGVDAIWISPIFPSPMADFGYDVADYRGVDPRFGTLHDLDRLIADAHAIGLRVLLDFVPNHSSDRHPWFVASRSSRTDPRRGWYIWRDAASDGGPPNNWISDFGGPAWQWDEATGQYYAHAFLKEQPDLNWRNPELRAAMLDVLRFWLDRGVDGFRIDVLWHMVKAADFRDNPPNPAYLPSMGEMHRVLQAHSTDQPEVHAVAADMRALADSYPGDRLLIGEIYLPIPKLVEYYGTADAPEVQLPFNFQLIEAPWDASVIADAIIAYEAALPPGGWPNWVLGNHDRPRIAARVGQAQARVAAMMLLTLRGTPTVYYGDELGLADVLIPADEVQDPRELREPGLGLGRDPVRTPMAWDATPGAGFSQARSWLPLHADAASRNVAVQSSDPGSTLTLYRDLLRIRRQHPALSVGEIADVRAARNTLLYVRFRDDRLFLIALNLGEATEDVATGRGERLVPVLSTLGSPGFDAVAPGDPLTLRPNEGLILGAVA